MTRRLTLAFLAVAALLVLLFCLAAGWGGSAIGFTLLAAAFPFALMVLGALRGDRLGAAALPIALLLVMVELSLVGMLLLRGRAPEGPWLGGLPLAAALQVYGIFLLPLAVTALGFALTFRRFGVGEEELERLRRLAPEEPG